MPDGGKLRMGRKADEQHGRAVPRSISLGLLEWAALEREAAKVGKTAGQLVQDLVREFLTKQSIAENQNLE